MEQEIEQRKPRVLVGCPTSSHKEYCLQNYASALKELSYENFDILIVDNSEGESYLETIKALGLPVIKATYSEHAKDRVINSRNLLREKALEGGYDFLLSLEQDVIPQPNIIEGLLRHNKAITTGVVYHLFPQKGTNEWKEKPLLALKSVSVKGKWAFLSAEQILELNALVEVDYCSMGCLLISRDVLEKIKFRYEEFPYETDNVDEVKWDDWCFCEDAQALGYKIYADLGAKCRHLVIGGYSITLGDTSKVKAFPEGGATSDRSISIKDILKE